MVLAIISKANTTKGKANKGDYIKLKKSCNKGKKNQMKMKKQSMEWRKNMFGNHVSTRVKSKTYKELTANCCKNK